MPDRDHAADARRLLLINVLEDDSPVIAETRTLAPSVARAYLDQNAALCQIAATLDVQVSEVLTATASAREYTESIETELSDERRLHAATAVSLSQAEARIEELSGQVAELQKRVGKLQDGPPQSGRGFCQ